MKHILTFFLLFTTIFLSYSQNYFQQKADYKIKVSLDDEKHIISGNEQITYTNNSEISINEIYILLYANAFSNKKTDFAKQNIQSFKKEILKFKKNDFGFIDSLDFTHKNKKLKWEFTDKYHEIAKIYLPKPLKKGEKITIKTPFRLKFPKSISRLGHSGQSYQVTQWYPKVAVYDKFGWHLLHYLDMGEFHSDFGDYDVEIELPENYIVGSTVN